MQDGNYWHVVWNQLREKGGWYVPPRDVRVGDYVEVTGMGEISGNRLHWDKVPGVVTEAGYHSRHQWTFKIHVNAYVELPTRYWYTPYITFDTEGLITLITKYR